ncbi:MAG: MFS transporter [Acidimicrobiia bacterium]
MPGAVRVQRTYLTLTLLATLAQSLIWGVNTLFLLDAGLTNTQAFSANALFSLGQLVFEVPTGVVADTRGRKTSYLWGAATLLLSTLLYLFMWWVTAPFWGWAIASIVLGLGFTFFSGAVEAWLVDALSANRFAGDLDDVFGRGQAVSGVAMLTGSVAGGFIAQASSLGVPYVLRAVLLGVTFVVAVVFMRDEGFTPRRAASVADEVRATLRVSVDHGWRNRPVRWLMLTSPFISGVMFYAFYAMQPYLLELFGDAEAFGIAGLASAIIAGAQIVGGLLVPTVRRRVRRRTNLLVFALVVSVGALVAVGLTTEFWVAVALLVVWGMVFSLSMPVRQAFINGCIPSSQRATLLSFDALLGSGGGTIAQPALGRVADVAGYGPSYLVAAGVQALALPFLLLARREEAAADTAPPTPPATPVDEVVSRCSGIST